MKFNVVPLVLMVCCAASAGFAQPSKPVSPLDQMEVLRGWVDLQTVGEVVTVHVGWADGPLDRVFKVELEDQTSPVSFRSSQAQVFFWRGNLAVLAIGEGKALHFSIPDFEAPPASVTAKPALGAELNALLARYELTKIDTATAIISGQGPRAVLDPRWGEPRNRSKIDDLTPPPSGGGGVGSCGVSCNISCADGSSCSATCGAKRCASCTCPASCTCS